MGRSRRLVLIGGLWGGGGGCVEGGQYPVLAWLKWQQHEGPFDDPQGDAV